MRDIMQINRKHKANDGVLLITALCIILISFEEVMQTNIKNTKNNKISLMQKIK